VRPALAVHGALARVAFAVAVLVSLAVLFAPASQVPFAPPGVDKIVHGVLFLVLALTGLWAGIGRTGIGRTALGASLIAYAAVSEVIQGVTPLARTASVADWLADVVGVLAGLAVWALARRRSTAG
jgi:VanZ family protein